MDSGGGIGPEDLKLISSPEGFGNALTAHVAKQKFSMRELAEKTAIPISQILAWMRGDDLPRVGDLARFLTALDGHVENFELWQEALTAAELTVSRRRHPLLRRGNYVMGAEKLVIHAAAQLREAEQDLVRSSDLELGLLWEVTHKRLDYYHSIATNQARVSFRNAQYAMAVGFAFLVGFAVLALIAKTTTVSIVTGALGAVGAAFAGYISKTFVQSQQSSAAHLRSYFDQPLELSRYLAAERVIGSMQFLSDEQRAQLARDLVQGIVASSPVKDGKKDEKDKG